MKKILIIPFGVEGVVDVRNQEYAIVEDVAYREQIQSYFLQRGLNKKDWKFCQFEMNEMIPFFFKIKNRLSSDIQEFEIERVKFSEIDVDEEVLKKMIEDRYIPEKINSRKIVLNKVVDLMIDEKMGIKVADENYTELKKEKLKIEREIKSFDYKKHLDEIV